MSSSTSSFTSSPSSYLSSFFSSRLYASRLDSEALEVDERQPSFFELLAQEKLLVGLKPAVHHVLRVLTNRYPQISSDVHRYWKFLFVIIMIILEIQSLMNHQASFSEHFYSLKRKTLFSKEKVKKNGNDDERRRSDEGGGEGREEKGRSTGRRREEGEEEVENKLEKFDILRRRWEKEKSRGEEGRWKEFWKEGGGNPEEEEKERGKLAMWQILGSLAVVVFLPLLKEESKKIYLNRRATAATIMREDEMSRRRNDENENIDGNGVVNHINEKKVNNENDDTHIEGCKNYDTHNIRNTHRRRFAGQNVEREGGEEAAAATDRDVRKRENQFKKYFDNFRRRRTNSFRLFTSKLFFFGRRWFRRIRQNFDSIFLRGFPWLFGLHEAMAVMYKILYFMDCRRWSYWSPYMHLLKIIYIRKSTSFLISPISPSSSSTFSSRPRHPYDSFVSSRLRFVLNILFKLFRFFSSFLTAGVVGSIFLLRFFEWWYENEDRLRPSYIINIPPPPFPLPVASSSPLSPLPPAPPFCLLPQDPRICAICHRLREHPSVIPSGYVFCYRCIILFVRQNGHCPITRMKINVEQIRRLFEESVVHE